MPKKIAEGDRVQIADREATPADVKSQLYYAHYRGTHGVVSKIYPDNTVLVMADMETLPGDVRSRHETGTSALRQKWLDGLSDEARNKLSAAEKKFALRYSLLVALDDLHHEGAAMPARIAPAAGETTEPTLDMDIPVVPRKSLEDLEEEEARHLSEIRQQKGRK